MEKRSWKGARRILLALFVASLFFPVFLVGVTLWLDYRIEWYEAWQGLDRETRIASGATARAFQAQDRIAEQIRALLGGRDPAAVQADELALHRALLAMITPDPTIDSAVVAASSGAALVGSAVYPMPQINLAGKPYFQGILAGAPGRYVSGLQTGSLIKRDFFVHGLRWTDANGQVLGIIAILVSPQYFEDFYGGLLAAAGQREAGRAIGLLRADGTWLAGVPRRAAPDLVGAGRRVFQAAVSRAGDTGFYDQDEGQGKKSRLIVYRQVPGTPLYVAASLPRSAILADWIKAAGSHLLITLPVALLFSLLLGIALHRVRREDAARAQLVTEMERRAEAEETLLRAQRLEAVGQVAGGVTHDFNNLLTIILGSVELLERRPGNVDNVCRLARNIRGAAERGSAITASLLAFTRRQPMQTEVVDINRALLDFTQLLRRAANESAAVLLDLAPQVPPVSLDRGQFEAAILNLVGNARDALPQGGRITLATQAAMNDGAYPEVAQGPVTIVTVTDDGTGMDATTAARAIEPFFTTKEFGRGTGLGLSQVYGFVKQSAGEFRIETAPGRGTAVRMVLPGCGGMPASPRVPTDQEGHATKGEVVLVVEDEARVRATAVEVLRGCGYRTLDAPHAEAALAVLRRETRVDLLFSDLVMPGSMSGHDLAEAALRLHPDIRILITSGYEPARGRAGPGHAFLQKSYDPATLAGRVREVLDLSQEELRSSGKARMGACTTEAHEEA